MGSKTATLVVSPPASRTGPHKTRMADFTWEARSRTGEVRKGTMEADTQAAVENRLRAQQLSPVKVKKRSRLGGFQFGSGVSAKEIVIFTRQFATMIDAGLPLVQCLDILANQ